MIQWLSLRLKRDPLRKTRSWISFEQKDHVGPTDSIQLSSTAAGTRIVGRHAQGFPKTTLDPRLYLNVNTPISALICGIQRSGKSHSASVMLEGGSVNYPCESAYLGLPAARSQLGAKSTSHSQ
ncbi:hypothetical protein PSTT_11666 [Puccinia striiformis]|uniref:Uncharacterized protein n=2 Tax=Puccinia striiformis TaxID=27350 RepID=A0A0L0W536_9BASI|nr:hypothetical protein PSTG_00503 [Puccinia striiformis f. sp. tritici PST-78]POW02616.1 hypothetical protein PSTT_11666 [Puccinia striiformis]